MKPLGPVTPLRDLWPNKWRYELGLVLHAASAAAALHLGDQHHRDANRGVEELGRGPTRHAPNDVLMVTIYIILHV